MVHATVGLEPVSLINSFDCLLCILSIYFTKLTRSEIAGNFFHIGIVSFFSGKMTTQLRQAVKIFNTFVRNLLNHSTERKSQIVY